ncbi:hypothetical protein ACFU9Y_30395 [Streptomyces sp. NPDC057621]|uniref:SbtR family transcriptional regulator n=1 Tax=Streptomyces sp. NPDC057621 TaxID=3346186 RepID=UPI0036B573F8
MRLSADLPGRVEAAADGLDCCVAIRAAELVVSLEPWDALESWLRQFVSYATTKKAIYDAIAHRTEMFATGRDMIHAAGRPLLECAQAAGAARPDVTFDDVLFLVNGVSGANFVQEAQRDRVLAMALDGIKAHG